MTHLIDLDALRALCSRVELPKQGMNYLSDPEPPYPSEVHLEDM
jgi:hypothetical protein